MMPSKTKPPTKPGPKTVTVNYKDAPNKFRGYCNSAELGLSPWDIRMVFGEILGSDPNGINVERLGTIVMAPAHAKAFLASLNQTIRNYESQFGPIDLSKIAEKAFLVQLPPQPEKSGG